MIRIDPGLIPDGSHDSLMLGFACNFISFNGGEGEVKGFDGTGSGDHLICIICLEPWLACLSGAGEVAGEGGRKEGGRREEGGGVGLEGSPGNGPGGFSPMQMRRSPIPISPIVAIVVSFE